MNNTDRSLERAARSFIEDGPTQAPDRAVEAALLRIETTPQERDLRIPWRLRTMTTPARVAAAAVVGVLVVGGTFFAFNRPDQPSVGGPDATASPRASSSQPASQPPSSDLAYSDGYRDLKGWIVFEHFGQAPDGSTTEFDFDRRMIWLVKADGSGLHELAPGKPAAGKAAPDISPDGTKVIFESWEQWNQVWEVGIEGGEPRLVSTDCGGVQTGCADGQPAYSPDGTQIALVRRTVSGGSETTAIAIRDLSTGDVFTIDTTSVPGAEGYVAQPTWSPDGSQIAYHRNTQTSADERPTATRIHAVNVDGSNDRELPAPEGEAQAGDPDWSPDGSRILFSTYPNRESEGVPGQGHIWSVVPDGSDLVQVCGGCLQGGIAPSWTPDGKHILFWGFRSWALMDPDGKNAAHINQADLTWFGDELGYGYFALLQPTP